tara:strand:- start:4691 stop:7093 length:2403 start_codon:yes stop_codon:yes gene_type:complete
MKPAHLVIGLILGIGLTLSGFADSAKIEFFEKKVRPALAEHCYECHSVQSGKSKGGLLLDTKLGMREGGDIGPAIVPGNPSKSLLVEAIHWGNEDLQMPPKKKLPNEVIKALETWVKMGAPDPRTGQTVVKDEIDIEEGKKFWAFQPLNESKAEIKNRGWPRSAIDHLVLAGLEKKGLKPAPDADKTTLARRVFFDLVGLPPSPEQLGDFLENDAPDAFEQVVDRLLASPQFGVRWGRHWLDVARYAESNGMERNVAFPHAWRFRDYVVESFNEDKPFDQFVREQVAGDLLPKEPTDERLVATGFLAIGPKSLNNRNAAEFKMDLVDEQIDVTTRAFMGLTVACARCHDHKFDPIPTEDYYSLAGIFKSTHALFGGSGAGVRQTSRLIELQDGRKEPVGQKTDYAKLIVAKQAELKSLNKKVAGLKKELKGKYREDPIYKETISRIKKTQAAVKKNQAKLANSKKQTGPLAMGAREGEPGDAKVHIRGNVTTLGKVIPRGFPQVFDFSDLKIDSARSGRLQLADWITDPANPLTPRVLANRVWHHLFGRGIVRTVDNFGQTGERPSNQPLLDHLAVRLLENEWSVKKLIREVVLSRAYRMSSVHDLANARIDPDNALFWKMNQRRLDAESMRDAMLSVSGHLILSPADGSPVQKIDGNIGRDPEQLEELRKAQLDNRSLYLPVARQAIPEVLKTFDFAEPSIIVGRRDVTTVPTQALFLLNSDFVITQARGLAERLSSMDEDSRIDHAFRLLFARPPSSSEMARTQTFLADCLHNEESAIEAWTTVCQALLASAEFRYLN